MKREGILASNPRIWRIGEKAQEVQNFSQAKPEPKASPKGGFSNNPFGLWWESPSS